MINSSIFGGVLYIIGPWIIVSALRGSGLINFKAVSSDLIAFMIINGVISVVFYSIGYIVSSRIKIIKQDKNISLAKGEISLIVTATLVFVVLMMYDFYINKEGTIFSITAIREQDNLIGSRMSVLGGVIALFSAAPYLLLCVLHFGKSKLKLRNQRVLTSMALIGIITGFLTGGRNAFLIGITILIIQYTLYGRQSKEGKVKSFGLSLYVFIIVAVTFSMYLFAEREMSQGSNAYKILEIFSINWGVELKNINFEGEFENILYSIFVIFIFYFTHAPSYFDQYFVQNVQPFLYGAYNFPIPAKLIEVVLGVKAFTGVEDELLLPGVYLTLPGSLYIDFGYLGACVIVAFLSLVTGALYQARKKLKYLEALLLSYLLTIWTLAPIYSVVGISNGFSFMFLLSLLMASRILIISVKNE
jgi:hypothetical protein